MGQTEVEPFGLPSKGLTGVEVAMGPNVSHVAPVLSREAAEPTCQMLRNLSTLAVPLCKCGQTRMFNPSLAPLSVKVNFLRKWSHRKTRRRGRLSLEELPCFSGMPENPPAGSFCKPDHFMNACERMCDLKEHPEHLSIRCLIPLSL